MKRSRSAEGGAEKKGVPRPPVPRPGTMAHLRYVEEQKRKKMGEQKPGRASASQPPEVMPAKSSVNGG